MSQPRTQSDTRARDRRQSARDRQIDPAALREKRELEETEDWLQAFAETGADELHPDRIGVRHQPEPKSIHAPVQASRYGYLNKPPSPKGKPREPNPYAYSRQKDLPGMRGKWQQRG